MNDEEEIRGFLNRNNISQEDWDSSGCDWGSLKSIKKDHEEKHSQLLKSAEFFAKVIQTFPDVHSVRWRIKDGEHLLEKIVRKKAAKEKKYLKLDINNYSKIVTDLIGIRALHLFKSDCFSIDRSLRESWLTAEKPIAYVREGDQKEFSVQLRDSGFVVKTHPKGYRSLHYVCSSQPIKKEVLVEIQVRTIFEEGWSEIDHRVRYPNFSNNYLVEYLLTIFNRMAGSADEVGEFVRKLAENLDASDQIVREANEAKNVAVTAVEESLAKLEVAQKQDQKSKAMIADLKKELDKLKNISTSTPMTISNSLIAGRVGDHADEYSKIISASINSQIGAALEAMNRVGSVGAVFDRIKVGNALDRINFAGLDRVNTLAAMNAPAPDIHELLVGKLSDEAKINKGDHSSSSNDSLPESKSPVVEKPRRKSAKGKPKTKS